MKYILSICLTVIAFGNLNAQENDSELLVTHLTEEYSINFPDRLELDDSGAMGTEFVIFLAERDPESGFVENISLMTQDLSMSPMNLDQFSELSESQIKTMFPDGELLESERIQSSEGQEYQRVNFTGKSGSFNLQFIQYYWVIENTATLLTYTTEQSTFEASNIQAETIMKSFSFN